MRIITFIKTTWILCFFCTLSFNSFSQAGMLDSSFDFDGIVKTLIPSSSGCYINSMALQSDQKIVVVGVVDDSNDVIVLARYNSNGSLDSTFDNDGFLTTSIGSYNLHGNSLAIQNDGKIVVVGYSVISNTNHDIALFRYNTNGSLDTTFDSDGVVTTDIGTLQDHGNSVAIQSDNKIVVTGYTYNLVSEYDIITVRYNTNGSLDSTFDTDGIVTTVVSTNNEYGNSVAVQNDGKILVAGYSDTCHCFAIVRYNTNGSMDNTFDSDGLVTTSIGSASDVGMCLAIQNDDKIVVSGQSANSASDYDFALARYNTNGDLDSTFNTNGIVTADIVNSYDKGYNISLQNDGKIVFVGYIINGLGYDFVLMRFNTNGNLDSSFDTDGIVTTDCGGADGGGAVVVQNDGKIVVAGFSNMALALIRYNVCPLTNNQIHSICAGQSITVGSNTYTISGTYIDSFLAVNSCDSIVTTNLTVNPLPTITTTVSGNLITAYQTGAAYQWIDCNNSNLPISGEINPTFSPIVNGDYAVIVTLSSCVDTTACVNITSVGVNQLDGSPPETFICPNPFSSLTILQTSNILENATLNVYNLFGQQIKHIDNLYGHSIVLYRDNLPSGIYFISLKQDNKILFRNKLVISD